MASTSGTGIIRRAAMMSIPFKIPALGATRSLASSSVGRGCRKASLQGITSLSTFTRTSGKWSIIGASTAYLGSPVPHICARRSLFSDSKPGSAAPPTSAQPRQNAVSPSTTNTNVDSHPILKRVPRFLRPFATRFIHAPISHVTAFLILHELTAIVPLVGIWWVLHKYHLSVPLDLPSWAIDKGTKIIDSSLASFDFSGFSMNEKFNFVMEGAYAFVIVKFLLPFRLMISLSLMPSFSRWVVVPFTNIFKRKPKTEETTPIKPTTDNLKKIDKPRL